MQIIADLQLHSKYSRAVSPQMVLPQICAWTRRKGMGLVATGDWTHPLWMRHIKENLEELGNGLLKLKTAAPTDPLFLLATEVSCIYTQNGKCFCPINSGDSSSSVASEEGDGSGEE